MQLELESGETYENPDAGKIAGALASLDGKRASFAILSKTGLIYLQVSGSPDEGFALEYQDGSVEKHYSSPLSPSVEEVINLFQSYASGNDEWLKAGKWEPMSLKCGKFRFSPGKIVWPKRPWLFRSKLSWLYLVPVTGCVISFIFGHGKKGRDLRVWLCVFLASIAAGIIVGQFDILRGGSFRQGFRTVYRSKSPIEFYTTVAFGFAVSVAIIVLVILYALGRVG